MALKALKRPKTESLSQSSEIEAMATSVVEWQEEAIASLKEGLALLSDDERMEYEERAAIMEYDGGLERAEAERQALERILAKRGNLNGTKNSLGFF